MTGTRTCSRCSASLSSYNPGPLCWPCEDHAAIRRDDYVSWDMARRLHGVTSRQIRQWVDLGELHQHGSLILMADLERLVASHGPITISSHCNRGHMLAGANLLKHNDGRRRCRQCYNARKREAARVRRMEGVA